MSGKYIYGIIDGSDGALDIPGLGGMAYTVAHRGVGCVLSDYRGPKFHTMSREQLVQSLLTHQKVVEQVMTRHTVLPARFGTVLAASDEVYGLLFQGHSQFTNALTSMADRVEIEVAATWNLLEVLQEVSNQEEVVCAREAIARGLGQATFEQRIRMGKLVKACLDRRRDSYRERMISHLRPVAIDVQGNALVSDQMVMNVAFLLDKANQPEFDGSMRQLNDLFHDRINFRVLGPLPPYSFATVEVTRPDTEKIEAAKRLLELKGHVSEPEVRRAYRRLAAAAHPDSKPGDEVAKAEFIRLRQASELLVGCCQGQAGSKGSLSICIRRQSVDELQHLRFAEAEAMAGAADD